MMTYQQFKASFFKARKKGDSREPMSEKDFNEMMGIGADTSPRLDIRPKRDARKVSASLENHIKIAAEFRRKHRPKSKEVKVKVSKEPKPRYKPPKIYTEEELKQRRSEARKIKRAENKANGLTVDGKQRHVGRSYEEKKEAMREYARQWRKDRKNGKDVLLQY